MATLMREPLLGFLVAAALIFLLYQLTRAPSENTLIVSAELIEVLEEEQRLVRGRELIDSELEEVIQGYIDEEVMVREAYARGLDRGDGRVRQRLIGKIDFLVEEEPTEPTQEDLETLFQAAPDIYRYPPTIDMVQILGRPGTFTEDQIQALVAGKTSPPELGNVRQYYGVLESELSRDLGPDALDSLLSALPGDWLGPFTTPAGDLMVLVSAKKESSSFSEAELARYLREDWYIKQRLKLRREKLDQLRENYRIEIESGI